MSVGSKKQWLRDNVYWKKGKREAGRREKERSWRNGQARACGLVYTVVVAMSAFAAAAVRRQERDAFRRDFHRVHTQTRARAMHNSVHTNSNKYK